jgi:predicted transglutaminase-like cysteine proteinase
MAGNHLKPFQKSGLAIIGRTLSRALSEWTKTGPAHVTAWVKFGVLLGVVWLGLSLAAAMDMDRLLASMQAMGGSVAQFRDWQRTTAEATAMTAAEDKLRRVNEFFNRRIRFAEDREVWGQSDYWATPLETLAKGQGDCEDFTIAKYFTLLAAGISDERLRLVYVKARIGGPNSSLELAHMVLVYYAAPEAEPLILDNLITDIRPASRRPDLTPVFSFNSQGIWQGVTGVTAPGAGSLGRLSRWQDLLARARREGFN